MKIGTLIHSMKILVPEVALDLYTSTIHPCMKYCCYIWAGTPSCYLELLEKQICRTCCFSWTLGSLLKCCQLKSFLQVLLWLMFFRTGQTGSTSFSQGKYTCYSDRLHDFFVTIARCYKDVYVSFFPCTARLSNSLPIECFPLTYDLNGFKYRVSRYLLPVGYF